MSTSIGTTPQVYQNNNLVGSGNAVSYYGNASAYGLTAYQNGNTTVAPQAGDILCFSGGPEGYGHVAIVCVAMEATRWT